MAHRFSFECVDRTLRDILSVTESSNAMKPFGGKPILLGGDFRQLLPVLPGGDRNEVMKASLISSTLWNHFKLMRLTTNMRLSRLSASMEVRSRIASFARWVLDIGDGTLNWPFTLGDRQNVGLRAPTKFLLTRNGPKMEALADDIYNDFVSSYASVPYLATRSIVCPTNAVVEYINNLMVTKVPGNTREYLSCDGIANAVEQPSNYESLYSPEFLNSIAINNFPQHRLLLKTGVPIVLLRNINQAAGLCNGTCLMVDLLGDRVIEAWLMTENNFGVLWLFQESF
jgi:ATP-dependent DNA helicase PIF1